MDGRPQSFIEQFLRKFIIHETLSSTISIMYIIYLAHIKMIYRLNTEIHVNKF